MLSYTKRINIYVCTQVENELMHKLKIPVLHLIIKLGENLSHLMSFQIPTHISSVLFLP
jgi:hypothetical protein